MNEIERAIEFMYGQRTQAANLYQRNTDERIIELIDRIVVYYDLAMKSLRAELDRENNPLTCDGCRSYELRYTMAQPCVDCFRSKSDRYEPKGEKG